MNSSETGLVTHTTIDALCAARDAAMEKVTEAARLYVAAQNAMDEAHALAQMAHGAANAPHHLLDDPGYRSLHHRVEEEPAVEGFRRVLDARVWTHAVSLTGIDTLMDRTAKDALRADLQKSAPPFTADAAWATLRGLIGEADLIFRRGLATCFSQLDRRFRSHDGFKLGSRVILTRVFNEWGNWNYDRGLRDTLADIERVFAVLDRAPSDPGALVRAIEGSRKGGFSPHRSLVETPYFRVRCFQNGNAHLWFLRDDLVNRANQMLADYYGEVLADGAPDTVRPEDLRSVSGLPAVNLSFYPTPDAVTRLCLRNEDVRGLSVLEPSAGTGNMVRQLLAAGAKVTATEIDPGRAAQLRAIPGVKVHETNFLRMAPFAIFDLVLMNPPFSGTHWIQHVVHAYDFLRPGGRLIAVLPATAETGETRAHVDFRRWAGSIQNRYQQTVWFEDLPAESFAESGTRVNTLILRLERPR